MRDRRAFLKWLAVLPPLGAFAVRDLSAKAPRAVGTCQMSDLIAYLNSL